ncbi:50S ribosomal protein L1 [candidate division MSBL1 archaeon SCGC-AAA259I09]|uniref:Large ribosomal subunit protein uL1 n=1 Tax=candidate division MSBL1 archaeon SCGC-AAA259I09 TaxID=1698267 RepID=A0A133UTH0_9EURY|nr:50S ribosomal protein L1 [candidate division MSBL1 archaeon SCGC-AAA259I09]
MTVSKQDIIEALKEAKEKSTDRNFTQTFDLSIGLKNLDLSDPENRINEEVTLPHGTGKTQKVAIFADGELAEKARNAGADQVFSRKELEELGDDKTRAKKVADEYGSFLAQADLMPIVGKELGPVLGPRGKMPNPIPPTEDPSKRLESSRNKVCVNVRENPVANLPVGREDMSNEEIAENVETVLDFMISKLPKGPKQIKSVTLKTTMGKPVSLKVN